MSGTENNNDCYFHYFDYRHNKKANMDELREKKGKFQKISIT